MLYKKVRNYRALRRQANQQQAKHDANLRPILSLRAVLAWKIGLAKFQCCITFILDLVYRLGSRFRVNETSQISERYSVQMKAAMKQKRFVMLGQMYL